MQFKLFNLIFYMGIATVAYFNIYFRDIGLTSTQIGNINSLGKGAALVLLPLWGMISDYYKVNKRLLIAALGGTIIFSLSLLLTQEFLWIAAIMVAFFIFLTPIVPLVDAQLLGYLGDEGEQYGKYRIWGSVGFMIVVSAVGWFLEETNPSNLFYISGAAFMLALFISFKLPKGDVRLKIGSFSKFKLLFKQKSLLAFVVFEFFIYLTLNVYNVFFPIYFMDQGGGETLVGIALMIAAGSELAVFYFSDEIIERFKLRYIFLLSTIAFVFRWFILFFYPQPMIILTSQLLHSLTFGLFHVTSVNFINIISGKRFRATGQNLYAAVKEVSAIISGTLGGLLYDSLGGNNLFLMLSIIALVAGSAYFLVLNYQAKKSEYGEKI